MKEERLIELVEGYIRTSLIGEQDDTQPETLKFLSDSSLWKELDSDHREALKKFFMLFMKSTDSIAETLSADLPAELRSKIKKTIDDLDPVSGDKVKDIIENHPAEFFTLLGSVPEIQEKHKQYFQNIHVSKVAAPLGSITPKIVQLGQWLHRQQLNDDGSEKDASEFTNNEKRIFLELRDELIRAISLYNIFTVSLEVYRIMLEKKPSTVKSKMASVIKKAVPSLSSALDANPWSKMSSAISNIRGRFSEAMFDANPNHVKIIKKSEVRPKAEEIASANQSDLDRLYPIPGKKNREEWTDSLSNIAPIVSMTFRKLSGEKEFVDPKYISAGGGDAQVLVVNLQKTGAKLDALNKQTGGENPSWNRAQREVLETLRKDYPNLSESELHDLGLTLSNLSPEDSPSPDKIRQMAKNLKVADDAYILMGFATYYYGKAQLFPTDLGIDVIKQQIFRRFLRSVPNDVKGNWPDPNILTKTNFGKNYKEIPEKIRNYGDLLDRNLGSHTDRVKRFLQKVQQQEKLFDSEEGRRNSPKIISAIAEELTKVLEPSNLKAEKADLLPKMVKSFMDESPTISANKLTAQIIRLFEFIKNEPTTTAEAPDSPADIQKIQFLQKITGEEEVKIKNKMTIFDASPDAKKFYENLVTNLKTQDPHCIKFLNNLYSTLSEIEPLDIDPSVRAIGSTREDEESSEESKSEELMKSFDKVVFEYADVGEAWSVVKEIEIRKSIKAGPAVSMAHEETLDQFEVRIKRAIKEDIVDPAEVARERKQRKTTRAASKQSARLSRGLAEQRVTTFVNTIINKMIKEENGKKELCN